MQYKAIMLDLDDTTVVHGKRSLPTPRVAAAISAAKEKILVCVATARTLRDSLLILDHLSLSGPCVLTNGTQIYDPQQKKIVHEVSMPLDILPKIASLCAAHNLHFIVYDGDRDIPYTDGLDIPKILTIYIPQVDIHRIDEYVGEFSVDPRIHVQKLTAWDKKYMSLDISSAGASKLHGIVEVAKMLGIKTEEMIGVGDGYNDFSLLMACGLKIAMGNAVRELKAIADFIAPTVYDDGVATVIEKFVLHP